MITFPSQVANELAKPRGTQPILVLEVDWNDGSTVAYSDSTYSGAAAKLISVGTIDQAEGTQISNQISVVLDSTDEIVEDIFRKNDVHLRPARLYLGFPTTSEKAILFEGLINSSVSWDEEGRTLQFQILSKLEDSLVAFTMEDGNFPIVSPDDRSKVWPLPFGTVCKYQSQRLTTTIKGFLLEPVGAVDPTLPNRICQIEKTTCPTTTVPVLKRTVNGVRTSEDRPDANCLARKRNEGCVLKDLLARQQAQAPSSFEVDGGENFPQNTSIRIRIGTVAYKGTMSGTTFTVTNVYHPDVDKVAECKNIRPPSFGYRNTIKDEAEANTCDDQGSTYNAGFQVPGEDCIVGRSFGVGGNRYSSCGFNAGGSTLQQVLNGGAADSWEYYDSMPQGRFIWNGPGTEVILEEVDDDLVYMVSLVPGTVTQVLAYRQFGQNKVLSQVPTDWYTVANVNYGGYQCVELRFNRLPSSEGDGAGWEDEIYVSFTSSVGPNPVDIIEWLVDTYTDFTVDSSNFAAVKASLTEFESNFVVQERKSVLELISEICYQQRMGYRISNGVVSLVYFGEEPTAVKTLTEDDLVQGSFKINLTETEELRTNHEITWREEYAPLVSGEDTEKKIQMRFNIPKYGTTNEEQDWYTQNTFATVLKTSTFWLIRKSNTWQRVQFSTTLEHLDLELYDSVTLDIDDFPTTKIVIDSKKYDTENNLVVFEAWTPVRAGEDTPYQWAWPAAVPLGKVWPTAADVDQTNIGDGSGLEVIPPIGHPLRVGYTGDTEPISAGDGFPSDVGFVAPSVVCKEPIGNDVIFATEPQIDSLARQNFQEDIRNKQNGNSGGVTVEADREERPCSYSGYNPCPPELEQIGDQSEPKEFDPEDPPPCTYYIRLGYLIPNLIRTGCTSGPCTPTDGVQGYACSVSDIVYVESTVTSYQAAKNAVDNHIQQANYFQDACLHERGVVAPALIASIRSYSGNGSVYLGVEPPADACADTSDVDLDIRHIPRVEEGSAPIPEGQEVPQPDVN